jgi:hypothetical protein
VPTPAPGYCIRYPLSDHESDDVTSTVCPNILYIYLESLISASVPVRRGRAGIAGQGRTEDRRTGRAEREKERKRGMGAWRRVEWAAVWLGSLAARPPEGPTPTLASPARPPLASPELTRDRAAPLWKPSFQQIVATVPRYSSDCTATEIPYLHDIRNFGVWQKNRNTQSISRFFNMNAE